MRNTIYPMLLLALFLVTPSAWTQEEGVSKKDLEVAENIYYTLVKQELESDFWFRDDRIQAEFVQGYGVIFNINYNYSSLLRWTRPAIYTLRGELEGLRGKSKKEKDVDEDKDEDTEADILAENEPEIEGKLSDEEYQEIFIEAAKTYLAEYASLLHGLAKDHKVTFKIGTQFSDFDHFMVGLGRSRSRGSGYAYTIESDKKGDNQVVISGFNDEERRRMKSGVTITTTKSVIDQLASKAISHDQFINKLEVVKITATDEDNPEFELFATVIERLYKKDLSDTYFLSGSHLSYERYENLGIIYYMRVYSSNIIIQGKQYSMPTIGKKELSKAERNAEVVKIYPKFVEGLKDNILKYGQMIKDMPDEESIVFKVKLTECSGCDMPEKIELKIKKSVVDNYHEGRISADKAKSSFELSEYRDND